MLPVGTKDPINPIIIKNAKEVAQAFQWIYENTPLSYPKH